MFKRFATVCGAALQLNNQSVIARSKRDEAISKLVFYNMARLPRFARNDVQSYFGTACRFHLQSFARTGVAKLTILRGANNHAAPTSSTIRDSAAVERDLESMPVL